jgi:transposase
VSRVPTEFSSLEGFQLPLRAWGLILWAVGRPLAFHLTGGEAADCKAYETLIDLPERTPDALLADKGYDADALDQAIHGNPPMIPAIMERL